MIIRFVKMTFQDDKVAEFESVFYQTRPGILNFKGCNNVNLYADAKSKNVYFTISEWDSEEDLDAYRSSDFFRKTWSAVKPLFCSRAEAWSLAPRPNDE